VSVAAIKDSVDVTTIQFDISSDWEGSLIARICKAVGIRPQQAVLVWSSPPYESYSQLQYTNFSTGNHCREVHDPERPPRSLKSCEKQADFAKRQLTYTHDDMISRVNNSHVQDHQRGLKYALAVEHPANSMRQHMYRPFMQQTDWTELTDRTVVDYCNYCSSHYHKPAGVYVYTPHNSDGNLQGSLELAGAVKIAMLADGYGMIRASQECGMCTTFS
jgi:hypothetical protein